MFADRLKELRKKHNITQIKFAEIFNISSGTIAMWETDKRVPDIDTMIRIANYFNVSLDWLIGNTVKFDFAPHEIENAEIVCPICGSNCVRFTKTISIDFDNERSNGAALEFCCEDKHNFFYVVESYKGTTSIVETDGSTICKPIPEIDYESAPVSLAEMWDENTTSKNNLDTLKHKEASSTPAIPELRQYRWDFNAEDDINKLYNQVCLSIHTLHSDSIASVLLSAIDLPANQPCEIDENKLKWLAIHSETSSAFFHDDRAATPNHRTLREIADDYARGNVMSLEELKQECPEAELWERNYNSLYSEVISLAIQNEYIGEILDMFANCRSEAEQGELMVYIRQAVRAFKEDQRSRRSGASSRNAEMLPASKK